MLNSVSLNSHRINYILAKCKRVSSAVLPLLGVVRVLFSVPLPSTFGSPLTAALGLSSIRNIQGDWDSRPPKTRRMKPEDLGKHAGFRASAPRRLPGGFSLSYCELGWAWEMGDSPSRPAAHLVYYRDSDHARLDLFEDKAYGLPEVNVKGLYDRHIFASPPSEFPLYRRMGQTDAMIILPTKVTLKEGYRILDWLKKSRKLA